MNARLAQIAWSNLLRHRRRNALSLFAIVLGFLGMSCFFDYVTWAEGWMATVSVYLNHNGHVTVYKEGALDRYYSRPRRYLIPADAQAKVAAIAQADPRVEMTGRYLKGMGLLSRGGTSAAFIAQGVDLAIEQRVLEHPEVRRWVGDYVQNQYQGTLYGHGGTLPPVAVSGGLARLSGYSFAHPEAGRDVQLVASTFEGGLSALDAGIVSRFSTGLAFSDDSGLMTSLEALQKLYDTDGVSSIAIFLKDRSQLRAFERDFRRRLADAGLKLEVQDYLDERLSPYYVGATQFIYAAAAFFLILVSLVVVISLGNTMSMAVLERSREIGTLRSLGFLPAQVRRIFLFEGVYLTAIGIAIGALLNEVASYLVVHCANIRFTPPGIAGDTQFMIIPDARVSVALAAVFLVVGLVAIATMIRSRTSLPVAQLFAGR